MAALNAISPKQLNRLIGTPACPVIVDISIDPDFDEDPYLIPGSFRHPHSDIPGLIDRLNGRACVISCQQGIKLSQGLASWLRGEGIDAQYLEGGMYGWRATEGLARIPASIMPEPVAGQTLWVTRHRPKIDRIACPWLIRRFIDPQARFLFVSPEWVQGVADRYGAVPFDVPDVTFTHRDGGCSFDAFLDDFQLHSQPLDHLATIIRAADTNAHADAPEAAGLLALSVGLSRQYRDDHDQLAAGITMYDALYRWARDGRDEGHDWPHGRVS